MKKIIISSIFLILLFTGAYYVVSNTDISPVPNKTNTNSNTTNKEANNNGTSTNNESSTNSADNNSSKILAPDFSLSDLEGNIVTLSELKGKKVFLNFWASWCDPCKEEMLHIEKLYQETKNSDLIILAINSTEDKKAIESFLKENNLNFTVLMDSREETAINYLTGYIPSSFFINKEGYIVSSIVGYMSYDEMKANIEALD